MSKDLKGSCRNLVLRGPILWVCLKMGYTPNYSHLVGIMISKTIGYNGVHHFQTNPYQIIKNLNLSLMTVDDSCWEILVSLIFLSCATCHFIFDDRQVGRRGLPCGCHAGCLSSTLGPWGWSRGWDRHVKKIPSGTLWWTNIAMENGHRNSGFSH